MKEEWSLKEEGRPDKKPLNMLFWKKHGELIATLLCGLLIISAYLFPAISVALFITAFSIGGFTKAKEGLLDFIQNRTFNVELLMILAAIGAGSIGYWAEGAILIFIFALSGALETYTLNKSEQDLSKLIQLQPELARRLVDDEYESVAVSQLNIEDRLLVKPGERFPIDGYILQGSSSVDESPITGESLPIEKESGDQVFAGTLNQNGSIIMKVSKQMKDTLFQKIVQLVQEAQQDISPSQQFIKRFERSYVKAVLLIVALMFILPHYLLGWSWSDTIYRALVLLVVASPCALVASVSPAVLSVLSYGSRNGVLIKGGSHIERLSHIKAIALDKTGTITTGRPEVTHIFVRQGMTEAHLIQAVAGLEQHSAHPLAQAIVHFATQQGITPLAADSITDVTGKGIYGRIQHKTWSVGNAHFIGQKEAQQFLEMKLGTKKEQKLLQGNTIIFARDENGLAGAIALQDSIRQEALHAISSLKEQNLHVVMITGDQASVAEAIASKVGVTQYIAETLPDQKMKMIEQLQKKYGSVAMIGDGINDAPALAKADVGVAMGGGTDIALDTADLVLVKNNLQKISEAIRISKKMNRIIKQNICFSIGVIVLLILANYLQVLNLPLSVIGHEGSTILVILNGLRLLRG